MGDIPYNISFDEVGLYNVSLVEANITRITPTDCNLLLPYLPLDVYSIAILPMLGVFSVVGSIGNGLVIYVYLKKKDKLTSSVFILALAGTDIITCTVIMPFTIISIILDYHLHFDAACKIYNFLITFNVPLSAFIMVAIAVDRYICICHPFVHVMTVPRAKAIVSLLGAFASVLGLFTALNYDVYQLPVDLNTPDDDLYTDLHYNQTHIDVRQCEVIYTSVCRPSSKIFHPEFLVVYQKIYSCFYIISLLLVIILYALIYQSVISRRAKRQKQKYKKPQFSTTMVQTDESTHIAAMGHTNSVDTKVEIKENDTNARTQKLNNGETVPLKAGGRTLKEKKDHIHLANIKTAIMLGVVTIVFIIAFLPAWLMALGWIRFNAIAFYIYFIYNVANPVIYAFMNQMFRNDLIKLFSSCCSRI